MSKHIFIAGFIGFLLTTTVIGCNWQSNSRQAAVSDTAIVSELMLHAERCLDKPGSFQEDMDSAMSFAGEMERISARRKYMRGIGLSNLLRAKTCRERGQGSKAREPAAKAVEILSRVGTATDKAQALIELGGSYDSMKPDEMRRKIALYEQAMQIYVGLGRKLTEAQLREFIGDLYQLKQDYPNALTNLKKAIALYQEVGYKRLQGVYGLMGAVYMQNDNFVESLRYNMLAIKIGEQLKDSGLLMATLYNRLGSSYWYIENDQQALTYFRKAAMIARANKDSLAVQDILGNIARLLIRQKAYQEALYTMDAAIAAAPAVSVYDQGSFDSFRLHAYTTMGDFPRAEVYFRKLKKIYDEHLVDDNMMQSLLYTMAGYLIKSGNFEQGRQYLNALSHGSRYPTMISRRAMIEYLYYQADSATGDLQSAISHFRNFKSISDSSKNMLQSKQLGELQLRFETEKKDNDIKMLLQKNQVQETSLQNEKVIRNVVVAGISILIVFLGLIYSRYRNKKITNIRLENQQNEINKQNEALRKLVDDKEWLLKEIHHRVKNNLQVIISLLNTQSRYLNNKDALDAIRNSQQRMYSMSLIHQRLYQTDSLGKLDMRWYIPELISYMKDGHEARNNIEFIIDCEHIELEVVQAVPLGLILNEAISNSMKYAFPDRRKGTITVRLGMEDNKNCRLCIGDNGVGIQDPEDVLEGDSLGMSLMKGLSEQLDGSFLLQHNCPGLLIEITFPYHEMIPDIRKSMLN